MVLAGRISGCSGATGIRRAAACPPRPVVPCPSSLLRRGPAQRQPHMCSLPRALAVPGGTGSLGDSLSTMDLESLYSTECPHGFVETVMRPCSTTSGLLAATPEETLDSIVPKLSKVTGLPVCAPDGTVLGVISRKDIIRVRKAKGSMQDKVAKHMTAPAVTITKDRPVKEAATLMLSKKYRRLPVVDAQGVCVGIVGRSDIFRPLFREAYDAYMQREVAAMKGEAATSSVMNAMIAKKKWVAKYLYDGGCSMCMSLKTMLERQDGTQGNIMFVNIADPNYDPTQNMGITHEEAMETIHVIKADGQVLYGTAALRSLFDAVGLGWASNLSDLPIVNKGVDMVYNFLSHNRISLGNTFDAVIAAKRVEMSKKGVETCGDVDEECAVEW